MQHFTYKEYERLLELITNNGYVSKTYHDWNESEKVVILRHDVDQNLQKALKVAEIDAKHEVYSTWFVLLKTDFYNVASKKSQEILREIKSMGHEIGLHFDEKSYEENVDVVSAIKKEASILEELCDISIKTVSMHRPSKTTLEANYAIEGIINSYGTKFFKEFKYLSDSRRQWREPVEEIIKSQKYKRLHILTHAFWYNDKEMSLQETMRNFIEDAILERENSLRNNITNFDEILKL